MTRYYLQHRLYVTESEGTPQFVNLTPVSQTQIRRTRIGLRLRAELTRRKMRKRTGLRFRIYRMSYGFCIRGINHREEVQFRRVR